MTQGSNTSLATGLGGGVDYRIFRPIASASKETISKPASIAPLRNNLRLSTGIVFRF